MRYVSRRTPARCSSCPRTTDRPRLGLCFPCYQRRRRGHELAGPCAICAAGDARILRRHRMAGGFVVLCANHAAIAGQRRVTLGELELECRPPGDRRKLDRRAGDRRGAERRGAWLARWEVEGIDRRQTGQRRRSEALSAPGD